jgi:mannosyltransferase OCH1-like enzyme
MNPALRATRFAIGRLIKLAANTLKGAYYLVHPFLRTRRFTLPRHRRPLVQARRDQQIPRVVWQTNFTDRVTFPVYLNYIFNRLMSPTYEYRFMTDDDCVAFVRSKYPGPICDAYENLGIGASKADFWRILVLLEYGGVYIDIDANLMWPLEAQISRNDRELFVRDRSGELSNFFVASQKGNPLLASIVSKIMENINLGTMNNIFDMTGPGAVAAAISNSPVNARTQRYVCDQGNFTNEYFQYADHSPGKWIRQQARTSLLLRPTVGRNERHSRISSERPSQGL